MDCGDPSSFLLMTTFTREAFLALYDILQTLVHHSLERRKGRKWALTSDVQLGLFLFYLGSMMNYKGVFSSPADETPRMPE